MSVNANFAPQYGVHLRPRYDFLPILSNGKFPLLKSQSYGCAREEKALSSLHTCFVEHGCTNNAKFIEWRQETVVKIKLFGSLFTRQVHQSRDKMSAYTRCTTNVVVAEMAVNAWLNDATNPNE